MTDTGLFTPEEQKTLERVARSQVWRLIQDALCLEREKLFSRQPTTTEDLWKTWGAIDQIQTLLHQGPSFVVFYQRHQAMKAEASEMTQKDREYSQTQPRPSTPPDLE